MRLRREFLHVASGCALALGLAVGSPSWAIPAAPYITVVVDGTPHPVPPIAWTLSDDGKSWEVTWSYWECAGPSGTSVDCNDNGPGDNVVLDLDAYLNPDPQVIYASSVIDFGAPSTFGFIFSQGIVPTPAPGTVSHTYSASATDGTPGPAGAMTVTPLAPPAGIPVDSDGIPEVSVYTLSTNGGTTFLNAELDLGPLLVVGGGSAVHGPFNPAPIAGPAASGSYDLMRVDVNFSLTGGQDVYTFNGEANVVPEPAVLGTLGLGLAGLALHGRRRFRS